LAKSVQGAEEESKHDLSHSVACRLRRRLQVVEADPLDPFGDQYALPAQDGHDVRNDNERVPTPAPGKRPLVMRLVLVIELLRDGGGVLGHRYGRLYYIA
jgi:hypothetical protein